MNIKINPYYVERYNKSTATHLHEVYGRYSKAKADAYDAIYQEMVENHGWGMKITSHSLRFFTCAYLMASEETGEILLIQHTPCHRYVVQY